MSKQAAKAFRQCSRFSQPLAPTESERTDDQAELIRHFDPVHLSLEQIESLQQLLSAAAASRRALDDQPEFDPAIPYLRADEVHQALEPEMVEDDTGAYHRGGRQEIDWRNLDAPGFAHQAEIDAVLAQMRAEQSPLPRAGEGDSRASASGVRASSSTSAPKPKPKPHRRKAK